MDSIIVHTDGGCRSYGKPNCIGSWAYTSIINGEEVSNSQAEPLTTNNIQEIKAILEAMKMLSSKGIKRVEIHSDSAYCVNTLNQWIWGWQKNGWKKGRNKDEEIKNLELWQELHELRKQFDDISFVKVKGHSTNEGNNRADELVNKSMDDYKEKMSK